MRLSALLYFLLLVALVIFDYGFSVRVLQAWPLAAGFWLGLQFVWLDHLVYAYLHPHEQLSRQLAYDLNSAVDWPGRIKKARQTLRTRADEQTQMATQNVLFAAAWVVLAFFGLTSTTGWLGKGLVMGIGFELAWRILQDLRGQKPMDWLFWPIKRVIPRDEQVWTARIFLAVFALMTLLV